MEMSILDSSDKTATIQYYCAKCRTKEGICTLEQTNEHNEIIGVIFVCKSCSDNMMGQRMELNFISDDEYMEDLMDAIFDEAEIDEYKVWN